MTTIATTFAFLAFSLAAAAGDGGVPSTNGNATVLNATSDNNNNNNNTTSGISGSSSMEVLEKLESMLPPPLAESLLDPSLPSFESAQWMARQSWEQIIMLASNHNFTSAKVLQRFAVATLYFATGGDDWDDRGQTSAYCEEENQCEWLTEEVDECKWFGVTCNDEGFVIALDFSFVTGNNLVGSLPAELSLLFHLQHFSAPQNFLSGNLDDSLGNLTSLTTLDLSENDFSYTKLPMKVIQNNLGLSVLHLSGNGFTGTIPTVLGNLSLLVSLDLSRNQLWGYLPEDLFAATTLEELSLNNNSAIHGPISNSISRLTELKKLSLGNTSMIGQLPDELFESLIHLEYLDVGGAQFSGTIPESVGLLNETLIDLSLNDNMFFGSIPAALDHLTHLKTLKLQGNQLTGSISPAICALKQPFREPSLATLLVDCTISCACCDHCFEPSKETSVTRCRRGGLRCYDAWVP